MAPGGCRRQPHHVNKRVRRADARRIFVNAVDDPLHATAYLGGVVNGTASRSISIDGRAPALSGLREGIDAVLPRDLEVLAVGC